MSLKKLETLCAVARTPRKTIKLQSRSEGFFGATRWAAFLSASILALCLVYSAGCYSQQPSIQEFDFHKYDSLLDKKKKEGAALRDLNLAFPPGSSVDALTGCILKTERGFCQKQINRPLHAIVGEHIYCEVSYPDARDQSGNIYVNWVIDIKYSGDKIEQLRVLWSNVGRGG